MPLLSVLDDQLAFEGLKPNDPRYPRRRVFLKVKMCQEMHSVPVCSECIAHLDCTLAAEYAEMLRTVGTP